MVTMMMMMMMMTNNGQKDRHKPMKTKNGQNDTHKLVVNLWLLSLLLVLWVLWVLWVPCVRFRLLLPLSGSRLGDSFFDIIRMIRSARRRSSTKLMGSPKPSDFLDEPI